MIPSHLLPIQEVNKKNRPTLAFICEQVASQCDVSTTYLRCKRRYGTIVNIRCVFIQVAFIYRYTGEEIGEFLNKRDYTTIYHALSRYIDFYNIKDEQIMHLTAQVQIIFPNVSIKPFRNHEYQD
jgi:chromosomal replication initiation ATPase DnaA